MSDLNILVQKGFLKSWKLDVLGEDGSPMISQFRNTERLRLEFPDGTAAVIETFCSGCNEDTSMFIKVETP